MPADTHPAASFTVADLARRWRIGQAKVRALIQRGELAALNLSATRCGRAQYRITPEAVDQFERRRSAAKPAKTKRTRQRRAAKCWEDFYPDDKPQQAKRPG